MKSNWERVGGVTDTLASSSCVFRQRWPFGVGKWGNLPLGSLPAQITNIHDPDMILTQAPCTATKAPLVWGVGLQSWLLKCLSKVCRRALQCAVKKNKKGVQRERERGGW